MLIIEMNWNTQRSFVPLEFLRLNLSGITAASFGCTTLPCDAAAPSIAIVGARLHRCDIVSESAKMFACIRPSGAADHLSVIGKCHS